MPTNEVLGNQRSEVLYPLLLDVLTELLEKDRLAHVVLTAECVIDAAKQQVPAWKDGTLFLTCITIFS